VRFPESGARRFLAASSRRAREFRSGHACRVPRRRAFGRGFDSRRLHHFISLRIMDLAIRHKMLSRLCPLRYPPTHSRRCTRDRSLAAIAPKICGYGPRAVERLFLRSSNGPVGRLRGSRHTSPSTGSRSFPGPRSCWSEPDWPDLFAMERRPASGIRWGSCRSVRRWWPTPAVGSTYRRFRARLGDPAPPVSRAQRRGVPSLPPLNRIRGARSPDSGSPHGDDALTSSGRPSSSPARNPMVAR
jgi:hypothetical protein